MPDAAAAPLADLLAAARAWAADDPDAVTRAELEGLAAAAEAGDEAAATELADAMAGMLEFGTAGLRGHLGGGPNRMNRAVVIRAAAGLTAYLKTLDPEPFVVVGYDARTNSDVFAHDTCAVVVGMGGQASVLPHPLPTPVLAYAIRHLGADAGVMVTASHNPPEDNGYKVYVGDGSQIVPPVDGLIAAEIAAGRVGGVGAAARRRLAHPRRLGARRLPRRRAHGRAAGQPPRRHRGAHRPARRGVRDGAPGVPRGRLRGADPGGVAGRARPDVPDRVVPQPRGAGGDGCRPRARRADLARRRDRQRPGCRPLRRRGARPRRVADAARRRGGRAARLARAVARGRRRGAARLPRLRLRELDRLVAPARGDVPRGRGAPRGDADRVQVDRPGAGAALRLRGGARLLRRPGPGARQGRRLGRPARRRARGDAEDAGAAPSSTGSTTSPASTGCTPPTRSRCGSRTCR